MYKKDGYAGMLCLLIVLAIGMMIYFLDMKAIFRPGLQHHSSKPEDHPWQIENLLLPENQTVPVPKKGQPQLPEPADLTAAVYRNNAPRGTVNITFGKDYRVIAEWSTQYEYDKKKYQLQTQMKGNIVPSKVYSDANKNEDKTRLFFIAKGPYTQTTQWADAAPQTEQGTAYITGWLSPNNTLNGAVTITTDQTWSAVYDFHTTANKSTTVK
jgi:hypothetical protein